MMSKDTPKTGSGTLWFLKIFEKSLFIKLITMVNVHVEEGCHALFLRLKTNCDYSDCMSIHPAVYSQTARAFILHTHSI